MKLAILVTTIFAITVIAAPANSAKEPLKHASILLDAATNSTLVPITDKFLFQDSMEAFQHARNHAFDTQNKPDASLQPQSKLDWFSDGCSSSPDHPFDFNFLPACQRHDFGYRNYHRQDRFTEPNREKIDNNLLRDLGYVCNTVRSKTGARRKFCFKVARLYWKAVREFGRGHLMTRLVEERGWGLHDDEVNNGCQVAR